METNSNQIFNYDDISLKILMELEKIKNGLKIEDDKNEKRDPILEAEMIKKKEEEENKKAADEEIRRQIEEAKEREYEAYGEKFMKAAKEFRKEVINNYIFLVGPIYAKITSLRNEELFRIFRSDEFIKFKDSLPKNQKISVDGYIIYRKETPIYGESLPGFDVPISYEYEYEQAPEDITFLFGSEEYIKKIKELKGSIISFKEYIKIYYELPYESPYAKLDFIDPFEAK